MADNNEPTIKHSQNCVRAKLTYNPPSTKLPIPNNKSKRSTIRNIDEPSNVASSSSYTRSILNDSPRKTPSTEPEAHVNLGDNEEQPVEDVRSNFVQMKEERDQCSQELLDFLSESLAKTKTSGITLEPINENEQPISISSLNLSESLNRSKISSPLSSAKPPVPTTKKPRPTPFQKSIPTNRDPISTTRTIDTRRSVLTEKDKADAKKFMLEQKQKRKQELKKVSAQSAINADERKRRLADLHKNSMKILEKCVRRKQAKDAERDGDTVRQSKESSAINQENEVANSAKSTDAPKQQITNPTPRLKKPDRGTINFIIPSARSVSTIPLLDSVRSEHSEELISTGTMPSQAKRIGLLRRSEPATVASPMDIHFDNILSANLCVSDDIRSAVAATSLPSSPRFFGNTNPPNLSIPNVGLQTNKLAPNSTKRNGSRSTVESVVTKKSCDDLANNTSVNVPYWLKPSPLQVYPYNFIMAVRKKLELIAHPIASDRIQSKDIHNTPDGRSKHLQKTTNSRRCRQNEQTSRNLVDKNNVLCHEVQVKRNERSAASGPQSISNSKSEELTNLSSMTLHVPDSSHSKNAPLASDSEGTLSISSAIFSQSSPEKKKPSPLDSRHIDPLSTANIDNITISSRSNLSEHPFIHSHRGSEFKKPHESKSKSGRSSHVDESNIVDMLNSFNQSLSHAISVNDQLHEALQKPIASGRSSMINSSRRSTKDSTEYEYSSKFESGSASGKISFNESQLENESSIQSSSLASDSHRSQTVSNYEPATSDRNYTTERSNNDKSISEVMHSSNRQSVIVEPLGANYEISSKRASSNSQDTLSYTSSQSTFINDHRKTSNQSSSTIHEPSPDDIATHRTSSSIQTELTKSAPSRLSNNDTNRSHRSNMTKRNEVDATMEANISESDLQNNKENVSSSINTDSNLSVSDAKKSARSTSSGSVHITNTIQESTVEFRANDGFNTYRNENDMKEACDDDLNQSIGSDIFAVFNQTDMMEYSFRSTTETVVSEANMSYSTLGMYDQLLKNEDQKTEDLTALLKIREKALIDRTKGQVAWLELQKRKYQERGLTSEITTVKKKQRALIMRLEKERAELARSAKKQHHQQRKTVATLKVNHLKMHSMRRSPRTNELSGPAHQTALKAVDMSASSNMEEILQRREEELRQRRQHVEHLIQWHQRLDEEEQAVLSMEQQLMTRTQRAKPHRQLPVVSIRRKQIAKIDESLEVLQSMSGKKESADENRANQHTEHVTVSGSKMNRLWRRLTGESRLKFVSTQKYTLTKEDIERLYEEAKLVVLGQFADGPFVLNQTFDSSMEAVGNTRAIMSEPSEGDEFIVIPSLNLNFTSGDEMSDVQMSSATTEADGTGSGAGYYFSDYTTSGDMNKVQTNTQQLVDNIVPKLDLDEIGESIDNASSSSTRTISVIVHTESNTVSPNSVSENYTVDFTEATETVPNISEVVSAQSLIGNNEDEEHSTSSVLTPTETRITENMSNHTEIPDFQQPDETFNADYSSIQLEIGEHTSEDGKLVNTTRSISDDIEEQPTDDNHVLISAEDKTQITDESVISSDNMEVLHPRDCDNPSLAVIVTENQVEDSSDVIDNELQDEVVASEMEINSEITNETIASEITSEIIESALSAPTDSHLTIEHEQCLNTEVEDNSATNSLPIATLDHEERMSVTSGATRDYVGPNTHEETIPFKMPDIISEAEVLRRQQLEIEQEIKQLEQNAPFVYLREIPNKPPPPYVPPAHGSPMTAIFPSEDRIHDIVYMRVRELHEADSTTTPPQDANVTNIYERIILDICEESFREMPPAPEISPSRIGQNNPNTTVSHFGHPLVFFNPPDRLECIQKHILQRVRKQLRNSAVPAYNNGQHQQSMAFNSRLVSSKRKRDLVDEILVQEMMEDDAMWTNFDAERNEVLRSVANDVLRMMVEEALDDCQRAFEAKVIRT